MSAERPELDWLFSRTRSGAARGPGRARALLALEGHAFPPTVQVVGTNGKGSTCAMLEAGLLAAGLRVGRFTSPHLSRFEERIRVLGHELDPARTAAFVRWAREHAPEAPFFELTLALAQRAFAQDRVDLAVVEAGVGGASDATAALPEVRVTLITNVALDHVATLGPGLADIARDKAGAARPGVPLLTTAEGEALEVIARVAAERGAPLYTPGSHPELFDLPRAPRLRGAHQARNAALALAALRLLGYPQGAGAALEATHPARLEAFWVREREVLLDGAHNPHAAHALAAALRDSPPDALLFGIMARKDAAETLAPVAALTGTRIYTCPGEGGTHPEELRALYPGEIEPDPRAALEAALAKVPCGGRLLVAGSLYLAGALRPHLEALDKIGKRV
ncbi:dihydrofolate synthase/folylpolyglutamate synthase [Deinobacterium chartae]|uniref:tetrahydrofolate synthase n=1 Tax=Deinobacterium chartae TaxID=521158 RepID=A0A841I158_9DEIO|nr:cyanophycin synthetase [Deinobacterium chartae]MBB6099417.1 dihydrofolate synthase/folylpolyglutamate synthase [Deinobacterium chartae]